MTEKRIHPLDLNSNLAVGLKIPLTTDSTSFFSLNYTTEEQAKTNLKNLILTSKGERYMQPNFGCDLKKMIFSQNDIVRNDIKTVISNAIKEWLPYIKLIDVITDVDDHNEYQLNVSITYSLVYDTTNVNTLNLNFSTN